MKRKLLLSIGVVSCLASISVAFFQNINYSSIAITKSTQTEYTLNFDSTNTPSGLTSSYQNNFSGNVRTGLGNVLTFNFVNAKSKSGGFIELANHGKIYNFGTGNSQLTAVTGIKFTGSGSLLFKPAIGLSGNGGILADMDPIAISAGSAKVTVPTCDYFEIEAGDSGASITTLSLYYACSPSAYDVKLCNGTYTGIGNDSYTYKITINNGSASIASLDKATNVSLNGTATLSNKTSLALSFTNLTYIFTYNGHSLTYVSKSGSSSSSWPTVTLNRVYSLENFESYSQSGQGYTNSTTKYQTTGLRSAFYADYYSSGNTGEIGGSGWPVMTSNDNITYNASKGHNNSKVGIFKFSNGSSMRYISMNELYGVQKVGKGTKVSFWARGAYTNTSFNVNHAKDTSMKFYAYYDTPLNPSNQSSVRDTFEYTVLAGSTWQHFEFDLDSSKYYYGFGFFSQQSGGSVQYVPIDDIEIYTASPYAEYVMPYPHGTYQKLVNVASGVDYHLVISLGTYSNGLVSVKISTNDMNATGISYNTSNYIFTISIPSSSKMGSYTVGNITGTYDIANDRLTNVNCSGQIGSAVSNVTLTHPTSGYYNCDGTTSDLRNMFLRKYRSSGASSWSSDTSNEDRIVSNSLNSLAGTSLSVRPCGNSFDGYGFVLKTDFSSAMTYTDVHFWVYNPCDYDIQFRLYVYKGTGCTTAEQVGLSATKDIAKAHSWVYIARGMGSKTFYNFILSVWTADQTSSSTTMAAKLLFDDVYFS